MNRIKIALPEKFGFTTEMNIRITDLNYGGHVGNDTILSILHEARQQFLAAKNASEMNLAGFGVIMADAMIEYKKELKYPGTMIVSVQAADFDKLGFDIFYKIELVENGLPVLAVKAKTGMMLFDYGTGKKASLTEEAIQLLS